MSLIEPSVTTTAKSIEIPALVPVFEANQGLLSLLSLAAALIVAVLEFNRANREASNAKQSELEAARREQVAAREARAQARTDAIESRQQIEMQYFGAAYQLLYDFKFYVGRERGQVSAREVGPIFVEKPIRDIAKDLTYGFKALLQSFPPDPVAIVAMQRLVGRLEHIPDLLSFSHGQAYIDFLTGWMDGATECQETVLKRQQICISPGNPLNRI